MSGCITHRQISASRKSHHDSAAVWQIYQCIFWQLSMRQIWKVCQNAQVRQQHKQKATEAATILRQNYMWSCWHFKEILDIMVGSTAHKKMKMLLQLKKVDALGGVLHFWHRAVSRQHVRMLGTYTQTAIGKRLSLQLEKENMLVTPFPAHVWTARQDAQQTQKAQYAERHCSSVRLMRDEREEKH